LRDCGIARLRQCGICRIGGITNHRCSQEHTRTATQHSDFKTRRIKFRNSAFSQSRISPYVILRRTIFTCNCGIVGLRELTVGQFRGYQNSAIPHFRNSAFLLMKRCDWAKTPLSIAYHDEEWGVPLHDDQRLFEFLILEGAQAGLSWETILRKRENYRKAFDNFKPAKIAKYDQLKVAALLNDAGIIRNRLKINSAVSNAKAFLQLKREFGSFDEYVWRFVNKKPIKRKRNQLVLSKTDISDALSKDLTKRGFRFVGSTICYAFMQAVGMVNDHNPSCFRYSEIK
jgi:DNA-3-methyladenine glycosylase I